MCPLCRREQKKTIAVINNRTYDSCEHCGLVALAAGTRLSPVEERQHYLSHENNPEDAEYRSFLSRLMDPLLPHLPFQGEGLDYGSGPGPTLSVMLAEKGFQMSIYDPFFAPNAAVLMRDYDFITCSETVEHFHNPAAEFMLFDRCLRPGGWLAVMTQMLLPGMDFASWWYHRDPTHVVFYRPQTMAWIAAQHRWHYETPAPNVTLFQKRER